MSSYPRLRSNDFGYKEEFAKLIDNGQGGFTDTDYGPYKTGGTEESMSDVVVDNYTKRIAQGEIINNPCNMSRKSMTSNSNGHVRYLQSNGKGFDTTGPTTAHYADVNNFTTTNAEANKADVEARCKLVALAGIDSTPYAFGEDALELRETFRFLKNPISSLEAISKSFRSAYYDLLRIRSVRGQKLWQYIAKGNKLPSKRDALIIAQAHAQVWVTYRFAVAPLVRSSLDAISAYAIKTPAPPDRRTSDGNAQDDDSATSNDVVHSGKHYNESEVVSVDGHAYIMYQVDNPIYDWKYRLGLRAKDIPTTIWQVVPYSFMVDRLLDISSFSKGAINLADPNVKILAAGYREKYTQNREYSFISRELTGFTVLSPEVRKFKDFTFKRSLWSPNIGDTIPRLSPGYFVDNATYVADTVALILGRFKMLP